MKKILIFVLLLVTSLSAYAFDEKKRVYAGNKGVVVADDVRALAFSDESSWKKVKEYARANDNEALQQFIIQHLMEGTGTMFKKGDIVNCVDDSILQNLAKVRKQGELREYWIMWNSIEKP